MSAAKIAITVPRETLAAVERRRKVLGVSRSAVITAALDAWLSEERMTAEERRYLLAYLRHPESIDERHDTGETARAVASTWEPWDAASSRSAPAPPPARQKRARARRTGRNED